MTYLIIMAFALLIGCLYWATDTTRVLKAVPALVSKNKFDRTKKKRKSDPHLPNLYY
jgi:hypothetical protein